LADGAATSLFHLTSRQVIEPFRFTRVAATDAPTGRLPKARGLRRALRAAIDDESADPRVRTYAIWASAELPDREALERLAAAATSPNVEVRRLALLELVRRGSASEQIRYALELLTIEPYFTPTILLDALPGSRDWDHRLASLIATGDPATRHEAMWLAAMIGKGRTERALIRSLQDPDPNIRCAAIWALHHRGDRAHVELLEPLCSDPEYRVRAFAERALRDLRGEDP
jgi:HEAT repeat protein